MKSLCRKIIITCFFLSILTLSATIAAFISKIALGTTGINLNTSNPNCTTIYTNIKFSFTGTSLSISFSATIFLIIIGSGLLVVLFNPFKKAWADRNIEDNLESVRHSQIMVKYQIVYIMASLQNLGWILVIGQPLNLYFQASKCTSITEYNELIIIFTSTAGAIISVILYFFVLGLLSQRPQQIIKKEEITFNDLQQKDELKQIKKKMFENIHQYLQKIEKDKEQTKQSLLQYQQKIYSSQPHQNTDREEQSQYSYYYEEGNQQASHEGEEGDLVNGMNIFAKQYQGDSQIYPSPQFPNGLKSPTVPSDLKRISSRGKSQKINIQGQESPIDEDLQLKNIASDSNTPSKIKLSPEDKSQKLDLIKPKKSITPNAAQLINMERNDWQELDNFRLERVDNNEPVNDQVSKLLKTLLFNNSPFFKRNQNRLQTECPIQKYIDLDNRFYFAVDNDKFGKKKTKNDFSKEVLVYARKRKDPLIDSKLQIKKQFDQSSALKLIRPTLIGQKKAEELSKLQRQKNQNLQSRYKKYNLLQSVRSKYH